MSRGTIVAVSILSAFLCSGSSLMSVMMSGGETTSPTGSVMLKCINTSRRGEMGWVYKGRVKTEAEARELCVGKKYMSLECPTADGFEVWCTDDISLADTLLDKECKGDVAGTSLHNGTNVHCVGPYKWGDVNGGGANRGALYEI